MSSPATRRTKGGAAATDLVLKVLEAYAVLHQHGTVITKTAGQTPARWQLMGALSVSPLTASQLARRIGNTRQAVQRIVNEMVADGLALLADNPDHARSPIVALTPKGERVYDAINDRQAEWANTIAQELPLALLERGTASINALISALDSVAKQVFTRPKFRKKVASARKKARN